MATLAWVILVAAYPREVEEEEFILWTLGFWLLAIGLTSSLAWLGVAFRRGGWLNAALVFTGIFTLTRYFDLFSTYGQTGLLFVGAGALLWVTAFGLEWARRTLRKTAGEETP